MNASRRKDDVALYMVANQSTQLLRKAKRFTSGRNGPKINLVLLLQASAAEECCCEQTNDRGWNSLLLSSPRTVHAAVAQKTGLVSGKSHLDDAHEMR
jgi:hypothetical protein